MSGIESGHCTARIEVASAPGGCLIFDYEAISDEHGLQHMEHAVLAEDALYIAFSEAPGVSTFRRVATGVFETSAEPRLRVVVGYEDEVLTWAWHWSTPDQEMIEQSRASCRRADS